MVALNRKLSRPDAEIAYCDTGDGDQTVIFTHGAGLDHTIFDDQVETLTRHNYRVVVWDVRGHGASTMAPGTRFRIDDALMDLSALFDACQLGQAVLVGHSFGGNLSQAFAQAHPHRVAGLIALATTWKTEPLAGYERLVLGMTLPILQFIPARLLRRVLAHASVSSPGLRVRTRQTFARTPKRRLVEVWRGTVALLQSEPSFQDPAPVGLVHGADDPISKISRVMPRWAETAGMKDVLLEDTRHIVTWDAPEAASKALLEILAAAIPVSH